MKTLKSIFAALVIVSFASVSVSAQSTATGNADAAANIITIIEIEKVTDLHFGDIVPSTVEGYVVVTSGGLRDDFENVTLLDQFTTHSAASFTVKGEADATYSIVLPDDDEVSLTGPGTAMLLSAFEHNATKTLEGGTETFDVGAKLTVGEGQTAGLYEATFNVTVAYE
jgi:hypothetical protein